MGSVAVPRRVYLIVPVEVFLRNGCCPHWLLIVLSMEVISVSLHCNLNLLLFLMGEGRA